MSQDRSMRIWGMVAWLASASVFALGVSGVLARKPPEKTNPIAAQVDRTRGGLLDAGSGAGNHRTEGERARDTAGPERIGSLGVE